MSESAKAKAAKAKAKAKEAKATKASESTLRDQFAMAALAALCHATASDPGVCGDIAARCYVVADAMLEARDVEDKDDDDEDETHPIVEAK